MELVECGSIVGVNTQRLLYVCIMHKYLSFCQVVCFDARTTIGMPRPLSVSVRHTFIQISLPLNKQKTFRLRKTIDHCF